MEKCATCDLMIDHVTGFCKMPCGHYHHPECIYNCYNSIGTCFLCQKPFYNGVPVRVDYGRDPVITRLALIQIKEHFIAEAKKTPIGIITGWFSTLLYRKDASIIINAKAPFSDLKPYTISDIIRSGVTYSDWISKDYTPEQLFSFNPTFDNLLEMQITIGHIQKLTLRVLITNIATPIDLMKLRATLHEIASLNATASELKKCGIQYVQLKIKDLTPQNANLFSKISPIGWTELGAPAGFPGMSQNLTSITLKRGY